LAPAASWRLQMSKTPVRLRPVYAAISSYLRPALRRRITCARPFMPRLA
jgi:hypothetical protein